MVGSPNPGYYFYRDSFAGPRSAALGLMLSDALAAQGTTGLPTDTGGASDHFSFEINGIPTSGLFSGIEALTDEAAQFEATVGLPADACYHLVCDTRQNVDTAAAALLVPRWQASWSAWPTNRREGSVRWRCRNR